MRIPRAIAIVFVIVLCSAAVAVATQGEKSKAPPVSRNALAQAIDPVGAPGRTLGLSRVKVAPGAQIALHHHAGTQIAYIQRGVLTYSVRTGSVDVMRGPADQSPKLIRTIASGQTGKLRAGQWIVEQPTTIHQARNDGRRRVVILLATLFTNGSPPSLPD